MFDFILELWIIQPLSLPVVFDMGSLFWHGSPAGPGEHLNKILVTFTPGFSRIEMIVK